MTGSVLVRLAAPMLTGALGLGLLAASPAGAAPLAPSSSAASSASWSAQQAAERADARAKQRNPTGRAAGSPANGSGFLKVSLSNVEGNRIRVSWKRPTKAKKIKRFVVRTSGNRQKYNTVRGFKVKRTKQSVVVPHNVNATPASGNFTFVQVLVKRTNGRTGNSPTKWIQASLGAECPAGPQVKVGTFNVRGWRHDKKLGAGFTWQHRGPRVVSTILRSGSGAVALQEAGSNGGQGYGPQRQWQWIVSRLNAAAGSSGQWRAASDDPYSEGGRGYVGTRLIYDAARFDQLGTGVASVTDPSGVPNAWTPWVQLRDRASGRAFHLVSVHLMVGESRKAYKIRGRQTQKVIALARSLAAGGGQVFVAGDFNSTVNTKPSNNVHRAMLAAGFYDAFATRNLVNSKYGTGHGFNFPVRPSPYRRDYVMSLGPVQGSCGLWNMAYRHKKDVASDHFMQVATLPLG